jgi:hypothetical protein
MDEKYNGGTHFKFAKKWEAIFKSYSNLKSADTLTLIFIIAWFSQENWGNGRRRKIPNFS